MFIVDFHIASTYQSPFALEDTFEYKLPLIGINEFVCLSPISLLDLITKCVED